MTTVSQNIKGNDGSENRDNILKFIGGILLHMVFARENMVFIYIFHADYSNSPILSFDFLYAIYYTFAYSFAGIALSLIFITPFVYFNHKKYKKKLFESIVFSLYIGVIFRVLSYFTSYYASLGIMKNLIIYL